MKATILGKEVELAAFTILVSGEKQHDRAIEVLKDFHFNYPTLKGGELYR